MSRHKLKPNLDIEREVTELIERVVDYYGEPYDDRLGCAYNHVSLRQVAKEFDITVFKARKLLITANCYSIKQSREVNELYNNGDSIECIMDKTGLSRSSVLSYLPYQKTVYKLDNKTIEADRMERWRGKKIQKGK